MYRTHSMPIATVNPATGELLRTFTPLTAEQVEEKLQLAAEEFPRFRRLSFAQRAAMMNKAAAVLESEKQELGRMMTLEMGRRLRRPSPRPRSARGGAAITPRMPSGFWLRKTAASRVARLG